MQDAIRQVKSELGRNAVILHTRRLHKGGLFGFLAKEYFEVMAAVDTAPKQQSKPATPGLSPQPVNPLPLAAPMAQPNAAQAALESSSLQIQLPAEKPEPVKIPEQITSVSDQVIAATPPILVQTQPQTTVDFVPINGVQLQDLSRQTTVDEQHKQEIQSLRNDLYKLEQLMEQVVSRLPAQNLSSEQLSLQKQLIDRLVNEDIEAEVAAILTSNLPSTLKLSDTNAVNTFLQDKLSNHFNNVEPITLKEGTCQIAAFIGPTGVGKTTTIAKLAAAFSIREGYRIALITADTYRIAAIEQLKTYADIIGIPFDVVYTPQDFKSALENHSDKDLILVDTAGRSPKNQQHIDELQALLAIEPTIQTHLVMSLTTKYKEALEIVDCFGVCSPTRFLFTKMDEATNLGTVVNLLHYSPAALSYITTGQNVPDDIEFADPERLASLVLR